MYLSYNFAFGYIKHNNYFFECTISTAQYYYFCASPDGGTEFVHVDFCLDGTAIPSFYNATPQDGVAVIRGFPTVSAGGSHPGSSHSASILDISTGRRYEFDAVRTSTDEIGLISGEKRLLSTKIIYKYPCQ